jgi:hypothetical protein
MAICMASGRTQCEAARSCGAGWHLCSATEYLARGGRDVPPPSTVIRAWIGACARDVAGTGLSDGVCSACEVNPSTPWTNVYDCNGAGPLGPGMDGDTVAVVTYHECQRVGRDVATNAAYWSIYWAGSGAGYAMCCSDG